MTRDSERFGFRALAGVARIFVPQSPILLVITILILVCLGSPTPSVAESTITCPPGTYDMLDWMTLDSNLRTTYHMEGTSNPLYTNVQSGKFSWTVPQSYKKFTNNTNLPLVPRCATAGLPGSTIKVANTNYDLHTNCSQTCSVTLGLQNGINQVWGPYYLSLGGSLPSNLKTLVISYRYNCNANYQCNDKEEYYVTQRYGLVQWIHYIRIPANGTYAQLQKTIFNKLVVGVVTPDFPCF